MRQFISQILWFPAPLHGPNAHVVTDATIKMIPLGEIVFATGVAKMDLCR
jgi:hypothetical protein